MEWNENCIIRIWGEEEEEVDEYKKKPAMSKIKWHDTWNEMTGTDVQLQLQLKLYTYVHLWNGIKRFFSGYIQVCYCILYTCLAYILISCIYVYPDPNQQFKKYT